jgi:hypothetical protein
MSTNLNCYEMIVQLRYGVNDHSTARVQGTDTNGPFKNEDLLRQINSAQMFVQAVVRTQFPELFFKSTTLSVASSVYALPSDLWKIKRIEHSEGNEVIPIDIAQKHVSPSSGSEVGYYRYGNNIKIDNDEFAEPLTIWYEARCRDLDFGKSAAGGALSLTLATTARPVADYYNGMQIENVTDSWVDTISDYSAARVCTITQTGAVDRYYGLVSELPEVFHQLILDRALIRTKMNPNSPEKPSAIEIKQFQDDLTAALNSCGNTDTDWDSVINDFLPY